MQKEVSIICRILKNPPLSVAMDDTSDAELEKEALKLSTEFHCKVVVCRDVENYGIANVYNGGSDFEVVEEDCFFLLCENGKVLASEHTDCWNKKAEEFLR